MIRRRAVSAVIVLSMSVAVVVGCGGDGKATGSAGSAAPSFESKDAAERAAAAREAAKKFGAEP